MGTAGNSIWIRNELLVIIYRILLNFSIKYGIIGVGVVGGVAYIAYKVGECNGEMNERVHAMADIEDGDGEYSEDDDEDHHLMVLDEPDDGCIAPVNEAVTSSDSNKALTTNNDAPDEMNEATVEQPKTDKPISQADNKKSAVKTVAPPVRKYAPLSSIKIRGISSYEIEKLMLWIISHKEFNKVDLTYVIDAGSTKINQICDAFLKAGYIRKEEKSRKTYCNLTKEDFYWLLLEE